MLSASELKVQGNTRRLIIEDPRERYTRAEIQNRVYKLDITDIENNLLRLENLTKRPITPFMKVSESILLSLPEYFVDDDHTVRRCKFTRDHHAHAPFLKKSPLQDSLSLTDQSATDGSQEEPPNTMVMETDEGNVTLIVQKSVRGAPAVPNTAGMVKFRRAMVRYKFVAIKPTAQRVSAVSVTDQTPNGVGEGHQHNDQTDNDIE